MWEYSVWLVRPSKEVCATFKSTSYGYSVVMHYELLNQRVIHPTEMIEGLLQGCGGQHSYNSLRVLHYMSLVKHPLSNRVFLKRLRHSWCVKVR